MVSSVSPGIDWSLQTVIYDSVAALVRLPALTLKILIALTCKNLKDGYEEVNSKPFNIYFCKL
uniref:Uncharacterized protein n=1 Tax=Anguilla anguilla TaxID=7936 RepID=A0A0E9XMU0_ANGAN